jgi:tetratricopeptide (TPR) repeat protein
MPSPSILLPPDRCARRARRRPLLLLALALVLAAGVPALHGGRPARAAESEDVRKAREHYKSGDEAFKAGRYEEAYREWEAGFKLSGRPLFVVNMAHAERKRGELRHARALYQRYIVMEPTSKLRPEIEGVLKEIDDAIAAEDAAVKPAPVAAVPPPVASPPLALAPPPPPDNQPVANLGAASGDAGAPVYQRWWFWTAAGVVTAGVLAAVLLRGGGGGDGYTKNGSLGTIGGALR